MLGNNKKKLNSSTIMGCTAQIDKKKNTKLTFKEFCDVIRYNKPLKNNGIDPNNSGEIDVLKNKPKGNVLSSNDIIHRIEKEKMLYNMTEGDDIVEESRKITFYRMNTTKQ